jgi:hypothetical protein
MENQMKTLISTFITTCILGFIISDVISGQTTSYTAEPFTQPGSTVFSTSEQKNSAMQTLISKLEETQRFYSTGAVLVIPTGEISTEDILTINEDINIMSRIIDDNLQQSGIKIVSSAVTSAYGSAWGSFFVGRQPTQSMYLHGYGALFSISVDFPLSAPADSNEQKEQSVDKDVDTIWIQTRQQIYESQTQTTQVRVNVKEVKYDAQKVENLKTTLIQSLKHAANIRVLKPDEYVILSITGSKTNSTAIIRQSYGTPTAITTRSNMTVSTAMVIRAKKSDIDAFAKGGLNEEKFSQLVQVISYPLLSSNPAGAVKTVSRPTDKAATIKNPTAPKADQQDASSSEKKQN